jgi:hypothetical protein
LCRAIFEPSDELVTKLELKAKHEVSLVGGNAGRKAWENRCRWAEMMRQDIAAMFVPYSCIHDGKFGGSKAILTMLEPYSAEICRAIENGTVESKMTAWLTEMRKAIIDLEQKIAALEAESADVVEERGSPPDAEEKDSVSDHTGVNAGTDKGVENLFGSSGLKKSSSDVPIVLREADDENGRKRLREESYGVAENQARTAAAVATFSASAGQNRSISLVREVFLQSPDTLERLTGESKFGDDRIMDSAAALLSSFFPGAFVLSLSMFESLRLALERDKKLPRFVEDLLKSKLVVLPVHLPGHFVAACIANIASDPYIFIYNDLNPNRSQDETVASKMVALVKKLRGGKGRDLFLNPSTRTVWVPPQRPGSNECWRSTILNMGIVAASGEATGPFEYKQESRDALRQCLIAIAKETKNEGVTIDAIPPHLVEAFKKCILGAVAQGVEMGSGGGGNVATVEVAKVQVPAVDNADELEQSHAPQQRAGAESDPKRAKMSVDGTDQQEGDEKAVEMQEQPHVFNNGESELKRNKVNPLYQSEDSFDWAQYIIANSP